MLPRVSQPRLWPRILIIIPRSLPHIQIWPDPPQFSKGSGLVPRLTARCSDTPVRLSRTLHNCGTLTVREVGRFALGKQPLNVRR